MCIKSPLICRYLREHARISQLQGVRYFTGLKKTTKLEQKLQILDSRIILLHILTEHSQD